MRYKHTLLFFCFLFNWLSDYSVYYARILAGYYLHTHIRDVVQQFLWDETFSRAIA